MPDYLHGKTQALLAALFMAARKRLSLLPCTETRMRLRATRFLIPDVAVFHGSEPPLVPDTPPLIAIEVLSAVQSFNVPELPVEVTPDQIFD